MMFFMSNKLTPRSKIKRINFYFTKELVTEDINRTEDTHQFLFNMPLIPPLPTPFLPNRAESGGKRIEKNELDQFLHASSQQKDVNLTEIMIKNDLKKEKMKKLKLKEPVKTTSWNYEFIFYDMKERIKQLKLKEPVEKSTWIDEF